MTVEKKEIQGVTCKAVKDGDVITLFTDGAYVNPDLLEGDKISFQNQEYTIHRAIDPYRPPHAKLNDRNAFNFVELYLREDNLPEKNTGSGRNGSSISSHPSRKRTFEA